MKRFLLVLLLAVMPLMGFAAETQEQIIDKIDEHTNCKSPTKENFAVCADYIIKNSSLGYVESLINNKTAGFINVVGSGLLGEEFNIQPSESTTGFNYLFEIEGSLTAILCEIFLTLILMVQIMRLKKEQKNGDYLIGHGFGYVLINYATVFGLLVLGGLYMLIWGGVFVGILVAAYVMMLSLPAFSDTAVNDPAAYQQRAENLATDQIGPIFDSMVRIADNNDRMRLSFYQNNLRNTGLSFVFQDDKFSTCIRNSKADADKFFLGSLQDGELKRSQKCVVTAGYSLFDAGSVSYSGDEKIISNALIELNKQARNYQYEYKKSLCTNALKVENKRDALRDSQVAYADCLNVDIDTIPVYDSDGRSSFLPESDVTAENLKDIKTNAVKAFADSFAQYGVQIGMNMESQDIKSKVNFLVVMYNILTQQTGYKKWRSDVKSELDKISSTNSESLSAYQNAVGLVELDEKQNQSDLSGGFSKFKFIDRNASLRTALNESYIPSVEKLKSYMLAGANYLGGNMFDDAGFTGENCFNLKNTCEVGYLNQMAATSASNMAYAESVIKEIVFFKVFEMAIEQAWPDSPLVKATAYTIMFLKMSLSFSIVRMIAGLTPLIIFGGMMLATISGALFMILGYKIDLLSAILPIPKNLDDPVKSGVNIKSVLFGALWLVVSLSVMYLAFLFVVVVYSLMLVIVGYAANVMGAAMIGESGQILNSIISLANKLFIFQILDVVFILKLSLMAAGMVTKLQSYFVPKNLNNQGLGDKIQNQMQNQMSKIVKAF